MRQTSADAPNIDVTSALEPNGHPNWTITSLPILKIRSGGEKVNKQQEHEFITALQNISPLIILVPRVYASMKERIRSSSEIRKVSC